MNEHFMKELIGEIKLLRQDVMDLGEKSAETAVILKERCPSHSSEIRRLEKDISGIAQLVREMREEANSRYTELQNVISEQHSFIESLKSYSQRVQSIERRIAWYMGAAAGLAWFISTGFNSIANLLN